jgi:hypothetical protein
VCSMRPRCPDRGLWSDTAPLPTTTRPLSSWQRGAPTDKGVKLLRRFFFAVVGMSSMSFQPFLLFEHFDLTTQGIGTLPRVGASTRLLPLYSANNSGAPYPAP